MQIEQAKTLKVEKPSASKIVEIQAQAQASASPPKIEEPADPGFSIEAIAAKKLKSAEQ